MTWRIAVWLVVVLPTSIALGQAQPIIDFGQHIQPILQSRCIDCHGPKEEKGGLRVDNLDSLREYIQAGDAQASTLWTDYLHTQDADLLMPPASDSAPAGLPIAEKLLIRAWIDEGASGQWQQADCETTEKGSELVAPPRSVAEKIWAFQGLFHPASVHLPIALLAVSAAFVLFSFFDRQGCEPVAYHCLWIGALGAIVACLAGWSYAVHEGYGAVQLDFERPIDRHRWLGVLVAALSLLMIPVARGVRKTGDVNRRIVWLLAGLLLLAMVSVVGYQGGELTYGEDHYLKYFRQLFPQ